MLIMTSMKIVGTPEIRIGFVALMDAAPVFAARRLGLFAAAGVNVTLSRELGWANIRDKLLFGDLDAAHCLAAMLPEAAHRMPDPARRLVTAVSLGAVGNAIVLGKRLWEQGVQDLAGLAEHIKTRRDRPLRFGHVFRAGTHHLLLRLWLASAGIDVDSVALQTLPPPLMPQMLAAGHLEGYCVGEPWGHQASRDGTGWVAAATHQVYPGHPEKVLAVRAGWADRNPDLHRALVRCVVEAARWCDSPKNRADLVELLAEPACTGADKAVLAGSLAGTFESPFAPRQYPDLARFHADHANFPFRSQLYWLCVQSAAAGIIPATVDHRELMNTLYRPDLFREFTADMNVPCPRTDVRIERTFDGKSLLPPWPASPLQ